jgi:hypothetical protein
MAGLCWRLHFHTLRLLMMNYWPAPPRAVEKRSDGYLRVQMFRILDGGGNVFCLTTSMSALMPAAYTRLSCQPNGPGLHQAAPHAAATQPKSGRMLPRRNN